MYPSACENMTCRVHSWQRQCEMPTFLKYVPCFNNIVAPVSSMATNLSQWPFMRLCAKKKFILDQISALFFLVKSTVISCSLLWLSIYSKLYIVPMVQTYILDPMAGDLCPKHLCVSELCLRQLYTCRSVNYLRLVWCFSDTINLSGDLWCQDYNKLVWRPMVSDYNKLVWRPMVSDYNKLVWRTMVSDYNKLVWRTMVSDYNKLVWRPMVSDYNKPVWRTMVSDTVYVPIQGLLTRPLLTMRQSEHLLEPSARDLTSVGFRTNEALY